MDEASWQRSSSGQFRTSQSSIRTRFQNGARVDNTGIKMESRQPNEAQLESTWPWPDQFGITQDLLQATVEEIPRRSKQIAILGHSWPLGAPLQRRRTHRPWTAVLRPMPHILQAFCAIDPEGIWRLCVSQDVAPNKANKASRTVGQSGLRQTLRDHPMAFSPFRTLSCLNLWRMFVMWCWIFTSSIGTQLGVASNVVNVVSNFVKCSVLSLCHFHLLGSRLQLTEVAEQRASALTVTLSCRQGKTGKPKRAFSWANEAAAFPTLMLSVCQIFRLNWL